jgi:hypothetical protein
VLLYEGVIVRLQIILITTIFFVIACQSAILQEPSMYIRRQDWPMASKSLEKAKIQNPNRARIRYLLIDMMICFGNLMRQKNKSAI